MIVPFATTGVSCALPPLSNDIFGFLSKFKISDEPYPTPSEETFALVILPLKMG